MDEWRIVRLPALAGCGLAMLAIHARFGVDAAVVTLASAVIWYVLICLSGSEHPVEVITGASIHAVICTAACFGVERLSPRMSWVAWAMISGLWAIALGPLVACVCEEWLRHRRRRECR
jgi:hypothetical protein